MHERATEFAEQVAEAFDFTVEIHEFEDGTKTAADAAEVVGCDVAQIASSLVFLADGEPVVVVTSGANRVDETRLASALDAETVEMADPDDVRAATGYSIGGVPPFCHDQELPVLIDQTLLSYEEVWAAGGTPRTVFPIAPDLLAEFADASPANIAE